MAEESKHEKIMRIANNRGFFYPSGEIYTAKAGFWTYGHLGTRIKRKWEDLWREQFLKLDSNFYEIDDCNILPAQTFKSSGHLDNFDDPMTECEKCRMRWRADELIENVLKTNVAGLDEGALTKLLNDNKLLCPKCQGKLSDVRRFNMMFPIKVGAFGEEIMYLRPESAQSPYLAFKREYEALRKKIPLGLAVIGRAYRNEISPRQGFFRLREFTQAELQIFFNPKMVDTFERWDKIKNEKVILHIGEKTKEYSCDEANKKLKLPKFYVAHLLVVQNFYLKTLQIPKELFRFKQLNDKEKAFYNLVHFDVELNLETLGGFKEVAGVHYRGDHDLKGHMLGSKEKLEAMDAENNTFLPHVLELSFGVDRNIWALMDLFYREEKERTIFAFPAIITPYDVAVFPLVNKEKLPEKAEQVYEILGKEFNAFYDDSGSIGRRYRRQDEVGTKYCVTIDFDSLKDDTVTIRERDSMQQERVKVSELVGKLNELRA